MDLNLLKIFIKVADCGSLTKASNLLNHPKSKISRDIVKLEDELQQSLLIRTPRGISLTDHGFALLQATRTQLEELESAIQKVKTEPNEISGTIRLTAPEDLSNFILTQLISEFLNKYPKVKIELYSTSDYLDFNQNNIDLALRAGKLDDSNLVQKKIADIDIIYVASSFYAKSNIEIKKLSDIKSCSLAVIQNIQGTSTNNKLKKEDISAIFSSNSMTVLKDFVNRSKGIATLPKFLCKEELITKKFIHILPNENYATRGLYLLSAPATYTPKHVKAFKDYIYEAIKKELKEI